MAWSYEEKIERNREVLERLKKERSHTHEALLRWFKGRDHWNTWAEDMLARKRILKENGEWITELRFNDKKYH